MGFSFTKQQFLTIWHSVGYNYERLQHSKGFVHMTSNAKTDDQHDDLFQKGLNSLVKFGYSVLKYTPHSLTRGVSAGVGTIPVSNKMMTGQVDGLGDYPESIGMQIALPLVFGCISYLANDGSEKVANLKKELYPEMGYKKHFATQTSLSIGFGMTSLLAMAINDPRLALDASGLSLLTTFSKAIPGIVSGDIAKDDKDVKKLEAIKASRNKAEANTLG
jgi:hypothetical protein